jgi:hypothetical protein
MQSRYRTAAGAPRAPESLTMPDVAEKMPRQIEENRETVPVAGGAGL